MFIQVIQGKVRDETGLRECIQRWETDLAPGAIGYLGSTGGFCDNGTFIMLARFESQQAAMANSARPEQGAWWAEAEKCFDGQVEFQDCPEVHQWLAGGSDDAGFVQIMEGHSTDVDRMHEIMTSNAEMVHAARPEIIGGLLAKTGTDGYVEAVYFTSEAEARAHESMEIPEDLRTVMAEEMALMGDVSFFDLHEPMLVSVRR
jgi:hypothetical protein